MNAALNDMKMLLYEREVHIRQLEEALAIRDREVEHLRSRLDQFKSVFFIKDKKDNAARLPELDEAQATASGTVVSASGMGMAKLSVTSRPSRTPSMCSTVNGAGAAAGTGSRRVSGPRRVAVSAESSNTTRTGDVKKLRTLKKYQKSVRSKELIRDALLDNDFLRNLELQQIFEIVECMYPVEVGVGCVIIRESEDGCLVYILEALTACRLWAINRQTFQTIMVRTGIAKHNEYINLLRGAQLFKESNDKEITRLADVVEEHVYKYGEHIARQGGLGSRFYIVSKGELAVTRSAQSGQTPELLRKLTTGDCFGEQALLSSGDEIYKENLVVSSVNGAVCISLDHQSYIRLVTGAIEKTRKQLRHEFETSALSDFDIVATLGIGGFGRVELVKLVTNPDRTFALKIMKKQHIVDTKQEAHTMNERNIMMQANSHFIVKLFKTWKDNKYLYMLMEPCLGGEVWSLLRDKGYFDDNEARFYAACAMEALEFLHQQGVIYRDLKPENMLLDTKGYAKMVDFGFAKPIGIGQKTWTFCGTPEYVAPEIVLNRGHDTAVDLWSLGIFIYELLTGSPPFASADPMRTYNLILKGVDALEWPRMITKNGIVIVKRLCRESTADRLGCGRGGMNEVRAMRWFEGFDFDALNAQTLQPPFPIKIAGPQDTSNFDSFEPETEANIPADDLTGWDADF